MPRAWRIVKQRHARRAFDGEGARAHGGRWSSPGIPLVYLAESRSLAILEVLVHVMDEQILTQFVLFEVEYESRPSARLDDGKLPQDWAASPAPASSKEIGDRWFASGKSLLLSV